MATTESLEVLDRTEKKEEAEAAKESSNAEIYQGLSVKAAEEPQPSSATRTASTSKDESPAGQDLGSSATSTRSSLLNGSITGTALNAPHPKKFSHIDINKRFLEKNSSTSSTSHAASPSATNKPGLSTQKPAMQSSTSHSRLVTAKLTTDTQRLSAAGPGWSRPPSTSSSTAAAPSSSSPIPKGLPTPATNHAAPQLPTVGKVIQPQPRGAVEAVPLVRKDSEGKSVWGNTKPPAVNHSRPETTSNEFPTAAEVAHGKRVERQADDDKKQALAADADAFRGRHLGPNVHHWDEDEGDDSNFLDEVIQFEDGRQYTVQPTQDASTVLRPQSPSEAAHAAGGNPEDFHNVPVSKEERFADDFDRSWPPSRPARHTTEPAQQPSLSPSASSQSMHSPQDSSRVLFNERSNRLEPYSSNRFSGPSRDSYFSRRGNGSGIATSPLESRNGRDGPVQLLQKPGQSNRDNFYSEDRPLPRGRGLGERGGFPPVVETSRFRDRDGPKRDFTGPPHAPRPSSNGFDHGRSRDQYDRNGGPPDRTRRMSNVSSNASHLSPVESSREGRQLPPHLSGSQSTPSMWRANPTTERTRRLSTASSVGAPSAHQPSHSPVSSHAPLSPALANPSVLPTPALDIDEVHKVAMQSAAERARLRRQQEEEQREKDRERARRKAAEIEAKLKAAQEEKEKAKIVASASSASVDSEAISFIEDAVRSATQSTTELHLAAVPEEPSAPTTPTALSKPSVTRVPSSRGGTTPLRRPSVDMTSPATGANSWRSKAVRSNHIVESHSTPVLPTSAAPPPPLLAPVDHFSLVAGEDLEVVDFSEHGKLIGVHVDDSNFIEPVSTSTSMDGVPKRLQRPVATDFFQDHQNTASPVPTDKTPLSWRRQLSTAQDAPSHLPAAHTSQIPAADTEAIEQSSPVHSSLRITTVHPHVFTSSHSRPSAAVDDVGDSHIDHYSDHANLLRSPTTPYREAPMAALNDTMARIKGVIAGMHKPESKQKWLPSPLRAPQTPGDTDHRPARRNEHQDEHVVGEIFDVTGYEPPRSPKPAWNHFAMKVPRVSQAREPLSSKQLRSIGTSSYGRLDVLSLVPPFDGTRRRGLSLNVNDILFQQPSVIKGRPKFHVRFPKARIGDVHAVHSQPIVNLPSKPSNDRIAIAGVFGRSRGADGTTNWRKPPASPLKQRHNDLLVPPVGELDTVSRSPPPEMPSKFDAMSGQVQGVVDSPVIAVPPAKNKSQPKIAEGPAVAFYRHSPADVPGRRASPAVKFIVSSELEEDASKPSELPVLSTHEPSMLSFPTLNLTTLKSTTYEQPLRPEPLSSPKDPIVEFRKGNRSPVQGPITPPTHSGNLPSQTWAAQRETLKDSPSRPPDPEHLKAVWSSTSNKPEKPTLNSLRGIADDMNVPLAIQSAKMEDIPTPPPQTSTQASRMSIMHDITRTFQQVPMSSTSTHSASLGTSPLPSLSQSSSVHSHPSMTSPAQRHPQLPPSGPAGMRVPFAGYPSPMMSSPSPTLVYPQAMSSSPIPQPMMVNGQYAQPMWVPVPHPNGHTGMMRPMASPYGAQLMPYPHTGAMYPPHNMQGPGIPQSPSIQGRPANVMLTPTGSQGQPGLHPMYASSPVMMQAIPASMSAPTHSYPGSAQSRGPPPPHRGAYDHHGSGAMQPSASFGPPQSPAYPQVQSNMFVRPTW
ncbi:hypothetical protein BC835DRAFT_1428973 [Cytidiella melzeri]|nr:hypothetical protein BC835DRAFT_1428973 [Cytidiella melzeri]